uniref:Uncharacterized protein n=1 Tax=Theileria parva TaxID=5875 RepID=Q4N4J5_THEPA|eukprot:XP_765211.1 hypothetical protein [Theileria parva strain Muguga]
MVEDSEQTGDKSLLDMKMKEFENAKTLLISSKRPKAFLIRTACELLAGGTEVLILSALGDAMGLCLQLQMLLVSKNAATTFRIETLLNKCTSEKSKNPFYIPGLLVFMRKHPEFKGSRISPGYIVFSPRTSTFTPLYDPEPAEFVLSVNAGNPELTVGGSGVNGAFATLLGELGHDLGSYTSLFKRLAEEARKNNKSDESQHVAYEHEPNSQVLFAMCRLPNDPSYFKLPNEGLVFVTLFNNKYPFTNDHNLGFVYVVGPNGANYDVDGFLESVHKLGDNLVTALCDYNGMAKRETAKKLPRVTLCRLCLVSGGVYKHKDVTKLDVAKSLLNGIAEGYRHGPTPRFNFAYDEDVFRIVSLPKYPVNYL